MLTQIVVIALTVLFLHVTTWEGMINEWVAREFRHCPGWIKKPLYDCPICMAPWWGSFILFTYGLFLGTWPFWIDWIIIVFAAGGLNTVLIYMISSDKEEIKDGE